MQRFSALALSTFWEDNHSLFYLAMPVAGCLVPCVMFSSLSSLYPLDCSISPVDCDNRKCHHTFPICPGDGQLPQLRTIDLIELGWLSCLLFLSTVSPPTLTLWWFHWSLHKLYLWLPPHPSDLYQPRLFSGALFTSHAIKSNLIGPTQLDAVKSS